MGRSLYGLFLFGIYLWMDFSFIAVIIWEILNCKKIHKKLIIDRTTGESSLIYYGLFRSINKH